MPVKAYLPTVHTYRDRSVQEQKYRNISTVYTYVGTEERVDTVPYTSTWTEVQEKYRHRTGTEVKGHNYTGTEEQVDTQVQGLKYRRSTGTVQVQK